MVLPRTNFLEDMPRSLVSAESTKYHSNTTPYFNLVTLDLCHNPGHDPTTLVVFIFEHYQVPTLSFYQCSNTCIFRTGKANCIPLPMTYLTACSYMDRAMSNRAYVLKFSSPMLPTSRLSWF